MTLDHLFSQIEKEGMAFNNLFQYNDGSWQCNLRDATHAYEFGRGATAPEAIKAAIENLQGGKHLLMEKRPEAQERYLAEHGAPASSPERKEKIKSAIAGLSPAQRAALIKSLAEKK